VRYVLCGILSLSALRCREIQPFGNPTPVQGYQINGTVSSSGGVPIDGVDVILDYYAEPETVPVDTQHVVLADSTLFVDISVYTPQNVFLRRLFGGFRLPGVVPRAQWDGLDVDGRRVPSGKYFIRYTVGSEIVKQVPTIIYFHSTAMTDPGGHFTITNDHLPIGELFDIYDTTGAYVETIRIVPDVILDFKKLSLDKTYDLLLTKNQITTGNFILQ
jgi:hypothetical protein